MLVRRIARPMLASTFVFMGVEVLRKPAARAEVAAPLVSQSKAMLPGSAAALVPADPENAVRLNALVQIGGGLMLATGKYPRVASSVLASTLLPTTIAGHQFWAQPDPQQRQVQQIQFLKNISILGGLLLAAADTEGKPSLGWRGRRAAEKATAAIADALPSHSTTESLAHQLGETAQQAGERASALADVAKHRGSEIADQAMQRGSVLADQAMHRTSELADQAMHRGSEIADVATERGGELAERFTDAATERGSALADKFAKEAPKLRRRAKKDAKRARKSADHAAKVTRAKAEELRKNFA